jgi:hypothetical protein
MKHHLTDVLLTFLYNEDKTSFEVLKENKAEIKKIDAYFVPPGLAKVLVHYGFLDVEGFEIRGANTADKAFERLELVKQQLGMDVNIFERELEFALHKFLVSKDPDSFRLLQERHNEFDAIEEELKDSEMLVKLNLGLLPKTKGFIISKTNGFIIKGSKEVGTALEMLFVLKIRGIRVLKPKVEGTIDEYIAQRLASTFR